MNEGDAALREVDLRRWISALRWLPAYDRSWLRGDLVAGLDAQPRPICSPPLWVMHRWPTCHHRRGCTPVCFRAGILALLQLPPHGDFGHLRDLPSGWRLAERDRLRGPGPLRCARGSHCHARRRDCAARLGGTRGCDCSSISESVMVGFKCGVALFLASTQLPKLLGIGAAHGNFWQNTGHFLSHLNETNPVSFGTGLAADEKGICLSAH